MSIGIKLWGEVASPSVAYTYPTQPQEQVLRVVKPLALTANLLDWSE